MREIKFRYIFKNIYTDSYTTEIFSISEIENYGHYGDENITEYFGSGIDFISREQYTGLKDKDGIDIYEGDIIFNPLYGNSTVKYRKNVAGYVLCANDINQGCYLVTDEDVEIIGNIHENKDLLEIK